jgi:hypothetical protein
MSRQYLHNACIRCPSLLLPPADAPARLPLGVPRAGGGACTLFSGEGDCPGSLVLHPLGRVLAMEMLASYRTSFLRYHRASGGPHVWYISTCRTPPLILSVVPGWLALARAATSFRPAGGRRVLCGMRAPCACVHQRTIAQVCRAFCAILAQNVGIVRKTCRAEGKTCHKRVAFGSDVQGRLVLRRSSSQVVVEELHGTDRVRELLGKQQRLAYQA